METGPEIKNQRLPVVEEVHYYAFDGANPVYKKLENRLEVIHPKVSSRFIYSTIKPHTQTHNLVGKIHILEGAEGIH